MGIQIFILLLITLSGTSPISANLFKSPVPVFAV